MHCMYLLDGQDKDVRILLNETIPEIGIISFWIERKMRTDEHAEKLVEKFHTITKI